MRLRVQFTLVMATLAVAPTAVTGVLAIRTATRAAELRPEESLTREATTVATAVGSWVDAQSAALSGWRRVWDLDNKDPRLQEGLLRAVHRAVESVTTVALLDEAGRPTVPPVWLPPELVEPPREAGSPARAEALVARASTDVPAGGVVIGAPYVPPGGRASVVPVTVAPPGASVVLAAEVSLAALEPLFGGNAAHATLLLDGARRPLLGGAHPFASDPGMLSATQPGMDLSFATDVADAGDQLRGAVSAVPGTDWVVVAVEPDALAARAAATIREQTLLVGLLVLLAVSLAGYALERTIAGPIARLRDGAAAVARGDFQQRLFVDGADELVQLALAFNDMTRRLEGNRQELDARQQRIERFNSELQLRVEERTRELEAAQARLVQTGQIAAVAEVGAGLAHELNNPMTAILGLVQLMAVRGEGDPATLARLEEQVQRCREVVATMVRFASGEVDPRQAPVIDLAEVVRETGDRLRGALRSRGVALEVVTSAPAMIRMDPAFAEQIVSRMVEVAGLAAPEGGRVRLEVARAEEGVGLEVRAEPALPRTDDQRAAGVRLWVARRLVDLAGGVAAADEAAGRWRVTLPEA